jgi:two-component system, LytTR family, sensor kinase
MTAPDRRSIVWWALGAPVVCAVLALRGAAAGMVDPRLDRYRYLGEEGAVAYYMGWAALTPLIFFLARRVPFRRDGWIRPLLFHFATGVVITAAARVAITNLGAVYLAGARWADMPNPLMPFWTEYAAYCAVSDTLIYWLILGAGCGLAAYDEARARRRRAADLERALVAAQVEALKMKLQPHFLFNTLNSISFLAVEKDADGVVTMVERLGGLLRSSMQSGGSQLVTVREELALLDQYLSIEEVRFADRLHVTRRVAPEAMDALVPSLVLQPMVENSIKHGFSRRIDASRLALVIGREGDTLLVVVEDDGPGVPPGWNLATHCGRGLKNVIERLEKIYPGAWAFTLRNQPRGGAIARLRIPWQAAPATAAAPLPAVGYLAPAGR